MGTGEKGGGRSEEGQGGEVGLGPGEGLRAALGAAKVVEEELEGKKSVWSWVASRTPSSLGKGPGDSNQWVCSSSSCCALQGGKKVRQVRLVERG